VDQQGASAGLASAHLIDHYSKLPLSNRRVEPDVLGNAYEYLIKKVEADLLELERRFRVRDIATANAHSCTADDRIKDLRSDPKLDGIDNLAVVDDGEVVGVLLDFRCGGRDSSKNRARPLSDRYLSALMSPLGATWPTPPTSPSVSSSARLARVGSSPTATSTSCRSGCTRTRSLCI
jgi:hypothetical protein